MTDAIEMINGIERGHRVLPQVILIHLSNVTGLEGNYSKRSMSLLVSDVGTIVMGITSALAKGYLKVRNTLRLLRCDI